MYTKYSDDILDYDVKYYKFDRISIKPDSFGAMVTITYCANNPVFKADNPEYGELPDLQVEMKVVCFIGSITVPHINCTLQESLRKIVKVDQFVEAYFSCDARDVLDIVLSKIGDDIYVLDRIMD